MWKKDSSPRQQRQRYGDRKETWNRPADPMVIRLAQDLCVATEHRFYLIGNEEHNGTIFSF